MRNQTIPTARRRLLLGFIAMALAAMPGCGISPHDQDILDKDSEGLIRDHEYDQAIALLRTIIKPEDGVRQAAVKIARIQELQAQALQKLTSAIDEAHAKADLRTVPDWTLIKGRLVEVQHLDKSRPYQDRYAELERFVSASLRDANARFDAAISNARALSGRKDLKGALASIANASLIDPPNVKIAATTGDVFKEQSVMIRDELRQGGDQSVARFLELRAARPTPSSEYDEAKAEYEKYLKATLPAAIEQNIKDKRFYTGYVALNPMRVDPDYKNQVEAIESTIIAGALPFYLDNARKAQTEGNFGRAYFEAYKLMKCYGARQQPADSLKIMDDVDSAVDEKIMVKIGVLDFESADGTAKAAGEAGKNFTSTVITELMGTTNPKIGELRISLQQLSGDIDPVHLNPNHQNVSGSITHFVFGRVKESAFRHEEFNNKSVRMVPIEKISENPEYNTFIAVHGSEAQARKDGIAIPQRMITTHDSIPVDINSTVHKISGAHIVDTRLAEKQDASNYLISTTFKSDFKQDDTTNNGAQDVTGKTIIEAKTTVDLRSEDDVRDSLAKENAQKFIKAILDQFRDRFIKYANDAKAHLQRDEVEEALNQMAMAHRYASIRRYASADAGATEDAMWIQGVKLTEPHATGK